MSHGDERAGAAWDPLRLATVAALAALAGGLAGHWSAAWPAAADLLLDAGIVVLVVTPLAGVVPHLVRAVRLRDPWLAVPAALVLLISGAVIARALAGGR